MCILCHGRCMLSEINANCCVSPSVESDFLWPHGLPCTSKLPCTSQSPRVCSQSLLKLMSLSQWCCVTTSSSATPVSFCFSLPNTRVFSSDLALCIMWPMYWSFSINPCNEYLGLISFRINWFDLLAVQGTQESSPAPELKSINSLVLRLPHGPPLTSVYDYWKNHSFDYMDCGRQSDVSAF